MSRLQEIFEEMDALKQELTEELQRREEELSYELRERAVIFREGVVEQHRRQLVHLGTYLRTARWRNIATTPIIWCCILPALLMDLVISLYQLICFPVYGIPRVRRRDHVIIDRQQLQYLNIIEKINCVYCGYFNGVIAYTQEVAARTEQYWCPIKHASKLQTTHSRYGRFFDFGDSENYHQDFNDVRSDFSDLESREDSRP